MPHTHSDAPRPSMLFSVLVLVPRKTPGSAHTHISKHQRRTDTVGLRRTEMRKFATRIFQQPLKGLTRNSLWS